MSHEELLTSVVGSHARPGWFVAGIDAAERGEFGPADLAEMLDDAVDLAIRDQEEAGIDVVSDGEMRRAGFFTAEFYRHLTGVRALPSDRLLGAGGHDQQHRFEVARADRRPERPRRRRGVQLRPAARTNRPLKVTLPGPYTLSGRLRTGPGEVYATASPRPRRSCPILQAELRGLVDAGATIIQVDEPSPAIHPDAPADFAALFNAAIEPRPWAGAARRPPVLRQLPRPAARRAAPTARSCDAMLGFDVDELVLEFANREMAEVEMLREIDRRRPGRRGRRDRREELPPRDRPTRSPSGSTRCSRRASRPIG